MSEFIKALDNVAMTTKERNLLRELHFKERGEHGQKLYNAGFAYGQRVGDFNAHEARKEIKGELLHMISESVLGKHFHAALVAEIDRTHDCDC